ncbi:MAG: tetratricopeptide repeat protein, partial [Rubripirellula sp.]
LLLRCSSNATDESRRLPRTQSTSSFSLICQISFAALSTPGRETEILNDALTQSSRLLDGWVDPTTKYCTMTSGIEHLDQESREVLRRQISRLAFLMADAEADIGIRTGPDLKARQFHRKNALQWNNLSRAFDQRIVSMADQQNLRIDRQFQGLPPDRFSADTLETRSLDMRTLAASESGDAALLVGLAREQLQSQPSNVALWFYTAVGDARLGAGQATTRVLLFRQRIHKQLGNAEAAKADLAQAMETPPRDANDWIARGVSQLTDSPGNALEDFAAALRVEPSNFDALRNSAHVYGDVLGKPQRALQLLDQMASVWPEHPLPIASRGIMHARALQLKEAIADAEIAATLSPGARERLQIAGIYALASQNLTEKSEPTSSAAKSRAIDWLRQALRDAPSLAATAIADPDLVNLRPEPAFRALIGGAKRLDASPR